MQTIKIKFIHFSVVWLAMLCVLFIYTPVYALSAIDMNAKCTISITPRYESQNIGTNMTFTAYQVGITENGLEYNLSEEFADADVSVTDFSGIAAEKLADYALQHNITGNSVTANKSGTAKFTNLPIGIYLIIQSGESDYKINPFLVTVPSNENGVYEYSVDATPKTDIKKYINITVKKVWNDGGDSESRPDNITVKLLCDGETTDTVILSDENDWTNTWENLPDDTYSVKEVGVHGYTVSYSNNDDVLTIINTPNLVQTGQLNWPIPILAIIGILCCTFGCGLIAKSKVQCANKEICKKTHE